MIKSEPQVCGTYTLLLPSYGAPGGAASGAWPWGGGPSAAAVCGGPPRGGQRAEEGRCLTGGSDRA